MKTDDLRTKFEAGQFRTLKSGNLEFRHGRKLRSFSRGEIETLLRPENAGCLCSAVTLHEIRNGRVVS